MENPSIDQSNWREELQNQQTQVGSLQDKIETVRSNLESSGINSKTELEHLQCRVKTVASLLTYLKSRAGDGSTENTIEDILQALQLVTDTTETLARRVVSAESETEREREKVRLGLEEIRRKSLQIECMSARVEEMERFANGTNGLLNEMRERVEEMVEETGRQRRRAAENEAELSRVKRDFESLRSYVSTLISVRETLLSSEKQFQNVEKLFDRMTAKNAQLESEKAQKEGEVQKLMEENVRLRALVDQKEAQLLAMNEQCKFLALNNSNF